MTGSFNSNFFIVAATVIPVLYLALTLQGSMLDGFIKQLSRYKADPRLPFVPYIRTVGILLIPIIIPLFMFLGIVLEFFAFLALYQQKASLEDTQFIFIGVVCLLCLVAGGPAIKFLIAIFNNMKYTVKIAIGRSDEPKSEPDTIPSPPS